MLQFVNKYTTTVQVTIMWYTPGCDDGDWTKKGWWVLNPGQSAIVHGEDLADINRYWCYFASGWDGTSFWSGPISRHVIFPAFEWCEFRANTSSVPVGYRILDCDDIDDLIVELIP